MTGLPDGRGIALKISDGSSRARPTAMAGVLMRLGFDSETLRKHASLPVLGLGERLRSQALCRNSSVLGQ